MIDRARFRVTAVILCLCTIAVYAQDTDSVQLDTPETRLLLAISSPSYPVTPGDEYTLTYQTANRAVVEEIRVQSDYSLRLNILGEINATGMSFPDLRRQVETIVQGAYPNSLPELTIRSTGIFQVLIRGEIPQARYVPAWGLSRLGDILANRLGSYSSLRSVAVTSNTGRTRRYDLYKGLYRGQVSENPLVQPGDVIEVPRRGTEVQLQGQVVRPDSYQLLPGENLRELIEEYGGGLTEAADPSRIRISRLSSREPQTTYANMSAAADATFPLKDGDVVTVPSKIVTLPVVYFEGALDPEGSGGIWLNEEELISSNLYSQLGYAFRPGETVFDAFQALREQISGLADLGRALLIRKDSDTIFSLDLEAVGIDPNHVDNQPLQPFDRIVIPFRQRSVTITDSFVTVTGAVYDPGGVPFIPSATIDYYIGQAGGIDPERNRGMRYSIYAEDGTKRDRDAPIQAGDRVLVRSNRLGYNLNRYAPIIGVGVALLTTVVTVLDLWVIDEP